MQSPGRLLFDFRGKILKVSGGDFLSPVKCNIGSLENIHAGFRLTTQQTQTNRDIQWHGVIVGTEGLLKCLIYECRCNLLSFSKQTKHVCCYATLLNLCTKAVIQPLRHGFKQFVAGLLT